MMRDPGDSLRKQGSVLLETCVHRWLVKADCLCLLGVANEVTTASVKWDWQRPAC